LPVLSQPVQYFGGVSILSATSAVIDIDDERKTFQLSTIDAQGNRVEKIFDVPLSEVAVRGSGTRVRLTINGVRKWIDFSLGSSMMRGFGIAGEIAGGVLNKNSGVQAVIAALKAGGAQVRYMTYWRRLGMIWAIAGGIVVVFILIGVAAFFSGQ
jgi:hypothetical protein